MIPGAPYPHENLRSVDRQEGWLVSVGDVFGVAEITTDYGAEMGTREFRPFTVPTVPAPSDRLVPIIRQAREDVKSMRGKKRRMPRPRRMSLTFVPERRWSGRYRRGFLPSVGAAFGVAPRLPVWKWILSISLLSLVAVSRRRIVAPSGTSS